MDSLLKMETLRSRGLSAGGTGIASYPLKGSLADAPSPSALRHRSRPVSGLGLAGMVWCEVVLSLESLVFKRLAFRLGSRDSISIRTLKKGAPLFLGRCQWND